MVGTRNRRASTDARAQNPETATGAQAQISGARSVADPVKPWRATTQTRAPAQRTTARPMA